MKEKFMEGPVGQYAKAHAEGRAHASVPRARAAKPRMRRFACVRWGRPPPTRSVREGEAA